MLLLVCVACGKHEGSSPMTSYPASVADAEMAMSAKVAGGAEQGLTEASEPNKPSAELKKYIALRHSLTVETKAENMQAVFDATLQHCQTLNCQVLNASFNRETRYSFNREMQYTPPNASISVRIPPRNVAIFLTGLAKNGEVLQHGQAAEDKTNQVVDAEAHIKNLTELRDRLRLLLTDKSAKLKDIIEVERELAHTQSQLDSIVSLRKILALETDLVAVDINFTAAQGITEEGFFAPVAQALKNAGHVLMESFADVITFVVNLLPWLLLGIPVLVLARRFWLKLKGKWQ
ncbi:MAG: DUF4349 domain-containing protein [Methylotenera sp.]|nr:DUF4349 domain-containing protein [Methylotenera sp.]